MKISAKMGLIATIGASTLVAAPFTPEKILPVGVDGTISINPFTGESAPVRKGTVAATLNNIALLNHLLAANSEKSRDEVQCIKEAVVELLPSLRAVGVFDLFSIEEWISTNDQLGRIFVAVLYLQRYPDKSSEIISQKLTGIYETTSSDLLKNEIIVILQ